MNADMESRMDALFGVTRSGAIVEKALPHNAASSVERVKVMAIAE